MGTYKYLVSYNNRIISHIGGGYPSLLSNSQVSIDTTALQQATTAGESLNIHAIILLGIDMQLIRSTPSAINIGIGRIIKISIGFACIAIICYATTRGAHIGISVGISGGSQHELVHLSTTCSGANHILCSGIAIYSPGSKFQCANGNIANIVFTAYFIAGLNIQGTIFFNFLIFSIFIRFGNSIGIILTTNIYRRIGFGGDIGLITAVAWEGHTSYCHTAQAGGGGGFIRLAHLGPKAYRTGTEYIVVCHVYCSTAASLHSSL